MTPFRQPERLNADGGEFSVEHSQDLGRPPPQTAVKASPRGDNRISPVRALENIAVVFRPHDVHPAREDRLISKRTGEVWPVWGYKLPGGGKIFPGAGFDHNQWKAAYQPDLEKYDYDIAKKYIEGTVTGPAFKRFFDGQDGGRFPVGVLSPETKKLTGQAEYQAVRIKKKSKMEHIREHGIDLEDMGMVQEILDDGMIIEPAADKTERQFFLKKGKTYYALPFHRKKDGLWMDTLFTFPEIDPKTGKPSRYLKKKKEKGKMLRRQKK